MLIEKTIKIKILEEVWAGIEEKARNEGLTLEEYIKTLLETMLDWFSGIWSYLNSEKPVKPSNIAVWWAFFHYISINVPVNIDKCVYIRGYCYFYVDVLLYLSERRCLEMDLKVYTVKEVAEMLRVSEMSVSRYIKAGKLKAIKVGKMYRINEKDLKAFIATW